MENFFFYAVALSIVYVVSLQVSECSCCRLLRQGVVLVNRTKHAYTAVAPDELSFTVGETLHVINTRANYDPARHSWKWVAQRARKDGKNVEEGLIPSLGR